MQVMYLFKFNKHLQDEILNNVWWLIFSADLVAFDFPFCIPKLFPMEKEFMMDDDDDDDIVPKKDCLEIVSVRLWSMET